ncbi:MAG: hypothetical protein EBR83_05600 [Verrucomicrobia bacterium]|jgi:hypothetical protein|nr:hypothetical protein [Verrucomicrobiota bacterium]
MKNLPMLSALLLTLSVCAASAAPKAAKHNPPAKTTAPAKPAVGNPTLGSTVLPGGILPQGTTGAPKPFSAGDVVVVGAGGTLVKDGVTYPAGTYVVGKDGRLVLQKTSAKAQRPFKK